jgi:hypothetical protein
MFMFGGLRARISLASVYQNMVVMIFIEVLPEYHGIYPDIFRWIDTTWAVNRSELMQRIATGLCQSHQ